MKFCKDCAHYDMGVCMRPLADGEPDAIGLNVVTAVCYHERTIGRCGPDGKYWQAKGEG